MATRSTIVRNTAMVTHFFAILATLFITMFLATNLPSLVVHCVSGMMALIYVPAALVLSLRKKKTRWDTARKEVVYFCLQGVTWLAGAIVAGISGGPDYCNRALYQSGLDQSVYSINDRLAVTQYCGTMSAVIALSCLHSAGMALGVWWTVRIIRRLSLEKSETEADLWNLSTGEIMRRDIRERPVRRSRSEEPGSESGPGPEGVTPYVHPPGSDLERGQSQGRGVSQLSERATSIAPTTITRTRTGDSEIVIAEPEVDHGPYIPPPPYQPHYASTSGPGLSSTLNTLNPNTAPSRSSTGRRRPLPSTPIQAQAQAQALALNQSGTVDPSVTGTTFVSSPINMTYPNPYQGSDPPSATATYTGTGTATTTTTYIPSEADTGLGTWTDQSTTFTGGADAPLRRVLAEKEESKEVIRRALER